MSLLKNLIAVVLLGMAGTASAQLQIGNLTHMNLSGTVGADYSGSYSDTAFSSSHGVGITGDGILNGYYFNPSFLNFNIHPYYGRTQESATSVSIGNASGIGSTVNLFSGSAFPGTITYSKDMNGTGQFAVPGSPSLVTNANSNQIGMNWSENVRGLPHVSVGYALGKTNSNIIGIPGTNVSNSSSYSLGASHTLAGWPLNFTFNHMNTSSDVEAALTDTPSNEQGSDSNFQFMTFHNVRLLRGSFSAGYGHSSSTFSSQLQDSGGQDKGSNKANSVSSGLSFSPLNNVTGNLNFNYNDNLLSSVTEQLIAAGVAPNASVNTPLRSLQYGGGLSWSAPRGFAITGGITRVQQYFQGVEYVSTQAYGDLNYNYSKPLFGSLVFTFGMSDSASQDGNSGAGFFGNANYSRKIEGFNISASVGYSQNVQTLATFVTTSGVNYGAGASRKLFGKVYWHGNFNGGHSVFTGTPSENHSERFSTGFSRRRIAVATFAGQSQSYALLTANGFITPTVPLPILGANATTFNSTSYGVSGSLELIKRMSLMASYAKSRGSSVTSGTEVRNDSTVEYLLLRYPYRKVFFTAGYNRVEQGIFSPGSTIHPATSFSFGISRWLKVF
jgi:hypothetical protein